MLSTFFTSQRLKRLSFNLSSEYEGARGAQTLRNFGNISNFESF